MANVMKNIFISLFSRALHLKTPCDTQIEYDCETLDIFTIHYAYGTNGASQGFPNSVKSNLNFSGKPITLVTTDGKMMFTITSSTKQEELNDFINLFFRSYERFSQHACLIVHFDPTYLENRKLDFYVPNYNWVSEDATKEDFDTFLTNIDKGTLHFYYRLGMAAVRAGCTI
jgi:hypothetical protein